MCECAQTEHRMIISQEVENEFPLFSESLQKHLDIHYLPGESPGIVHHGERYTTNLLIMSCVL